MSVTEGFFDLFANVNIEENIKEYFKNVTILSINIYNEQKKIELVLQADSLIPKDIIFAIEEKIQQSYSINKLSIIIKYANIDGSPKEILQKYWTSVLHHINTAIPICRGILNGAEWDVCDNKLNINLQSCGADILKSKKCHNEIHNIMSHELGINLKVEFHNPKLGEEHEKHYCELKNKLETKAIREAFTAAPSQEIKPNVIKEIKNETKPANNYYPKKTNNITENLPADVILGKVIKGEKAEILGLNEQSGRVIIEGDITKIESRETKSGKFLFSFDVTDYKSSITAKFFIEKKDFEKVSILKEGMRVRTQGEVIFDKYSKENVMMVNNITQLEKKKRMDTCEEKRVELHLHTKMSAMDAVTSAEDLVKTAASWGHKAIAITDHGVVQAYPDAAHAAEKLDIKVIYGVEAYIVDDNVPIVLKANEKRLDDTFVVFDIETTGFHPDKDKITEIGAVKVVNGEITDSFNTFVNPQKPIPRNITELTGITDDMVQNAPTIEEILPKFLEFVGDAVFVAHNANFDMSFIKYNARMQNIKIGNSILDTLELSRALLPELKKHKLNLICEHLGVNLENHHRAVDDAKATAHVFLKFSQMLKDKNVDNLSDVNNVLKGSGNVSNMKMYHAVILVKNTVGLRNLYKLISESHLKYYHKKPRIPKSLYVELKEGLMIGSACEAGELYQAILEKKDTEEIDKIIEFYDYLEIQPLSNNMFLIENGQVESKEALKELNRSIVQLGEKHNKPVVATCDAHYLNASDDIFRRILLVGQGFEDGDRQAELYFRTTDEMLKEFNYLGEERAYQVVVKDTNAIADMIEKISPISPDKCPPKIEGAEEELGRICYEKATSLYGEELPDMVKGRLEKELNSIIGNGYAVMYIIAQKLVWKSLEDGYLVGSRGSVGSSFAATMAGITEVNPLPPHYICPQCKHSEFFTDGSYGSGYDLPGKTCPKCSAKMYGEGQDIPFETFLGFDGDKEPDIDLNFSGEYQSRAHDYTEQLFGKGHAYRAGTIGTLADKTAYGFVKKYFDERGIVASNAEINRLVMGCTGVKRTTGQHPGGIIVLPADREIYDFCPIQWPANDDTASLETTHFDYHSIDRNLLKLDILGHDDPTVIRMLEDLTGVNARTLNLGDQEVMKLFKSPKVMGITEEDINSEVGSFAIPEFGTKFVRQMLVDTQPTTFSDLVRISGLSHGTDVWLTNAQDLIKSGTCKLSEVICCRDDIMVYLIYQGLPPKAAFKIMESVRKGKGLKEEDEALMREKDVPDWYIASCKKIKYMFPKAHAAAYVMMAFRIAYFKLYYPEAFYATYFTVRADDFDASMMTNGVEKVRKHIKEIEQKGNQASTKEKNVLTILEVVNEMYSREFKFLPIDIYESDAVKFIIKPEGLLPPLNALQGLGISAAQNIIKAREEGPFMSKDDLRIRAKVGKSVIEILEQNNCLSLPESNQISLFG